MPILVTIPRFRMHALRKALLPLSALALSACGSGLDGIRSAADGARNASEQIATSADDANRSREATIMAQAETMQQNDRGKADAGETPRAPYEIQKDAVGDSWTIYDTANGRPLKIDGKAQAGMTHEDAEAAFGNLVKQNKEDDTLYGRAH
jgi:hypothetical protein